MQIVWYGHSFFEILSTVGKEGVKIIVDPFSKEIGLRVPKVEADLLLISHHHYDHDNKEAVSGNYFLIDQPGEYEVRGIFINAISSFHDNTRGKERGENLIFLIETEGLRICHLGDFGQKELENSQLEKMGEVDVLMIPVGGRYTIGSNEAIKIMSQIEPKITIPMHYHLPGLKIKLEPVEKFLKSLGIKSLEPEKKLVVKKESLSPEEAKVVLLSPK